MTTLRNLVTGLIRQAGHTRIAATIRKIKNSPPLLLSTLGLRPSPKTPMTSQNDFAHRPATRVTRSSRSRSARPSSDRSIVEYVSTSCARRPGLSGLGIRAQATNSAFPMSSAATPR